MDAIGLSVGLAGASFGSNKGYTVFAGSFYALNSGTSRLFTVVSKTFDNPVQGIMGWFGSHSSYYDSQGDASSDASGRFATNIALEPRFIAPNVGYSYSMEETSITVSNAKLYISYTPGTTTTIDFKLYTGSSNYGALCCYFYIFF